MQMKHRKHLSVRIYKFFRSAVALMCVAAILFNATPVSIARAEDSDDSYDMEAVANSLGTIMSIGTIPTKEGVVGVTPLMDVEERVGNSGLTMAYTSRQSSVGTWLLSKISNSSQRYDYSSLIRLPSGKKDGTKTLTSAVYYYAVYGHILQSLGLDDTSYNLGGKVSISRKLMGFSAYIVYLFASSVDGLFKFAIRMLQLINPFGWLDNVAKNVDANAGAQYSTVADNTSPFGFGKLMHYIAGIYSTCCNLSWGFIIPMMIAFYLAGMFLFKKTSGGKRILKRILFIAIGVPLIGTTYTSFLYNLDDLFSTGSGYANQVIASTFVDFESWASKSHLKPPSGSDCKIKVNVPVVVKDGKTSITSSNYPISGLATNDTLYNIKDICLTINEENNDISVSDKSIKDGITFDETSFDDVSFDGDVSEYSSVKDNNKDDVIDDVKNDLQTDDDVSNVVNSTEDESSKWVANLLLRYAFGDTYSGEQFASSIQARMTKLCVDSNDPVNGTEEDASADSTNTSVVIDRMMHSTSCYTNFHSYNGTDNTLLGTLSSIFSSRPSDETYKLGEDSVNDSNTGENISSKLYVGFIGKNGDGNNVDYSIFDDGNLIFTAEDNNSYRTITYGVCGDSIPKSPYVKDKQGNWYDGTEETTAGLSTMSMYNYLNSAFDISHVTVFGGGNVISNGLIKRNHYSVNIIGGGILSFIYWLDAIILLACIATLGLTYSIGMLTGTIKYTFKVIMAVPLATLGSLRHIAKFCGMVVAMIANILVTAVLYGLCIEFLIAITDVISSNAFLFSIASYLGIMSTMAFGNLIVIIIIIIITVILTRIRKQTVASITEWITQVIGKFFEADAHGNPEKPKSNIGGKIAGGLATGAAMMAGGSMLKGAAAAVGGALSDGGGGGNDGPDGHDGPNGGNGATGSTIEKENATHASSDKQTGSNTNKDEKTASEKDNQKNASSDKMLSDHSSQQALIDENNSSESDNSTHDAKSSETADHFNAAERNSESTKSESNTTESSSSEQKTSEVLEQAKQADSSGTVDLAAQNVEAAEKVKGDLHDAGDKLKHADFNGAVESVKDGAKDGAGAAAADAIALTTGNTKVASEAGHLTDDAAHDELNAGSAAKALGAAGGVGSGAGTSQLHQSPQSPVGGKKQLGGEGEQKTQRKQLSSAENGETVKSGSKPQQQSHGDGGTKTSTHSARASVGGNTFNANVTNNIAKGNINNVNTTQGGNSVNIQNAIGNKVSNSQQSSGNNVTTNSANSAGRNVQNIQNVTNVNNNSSSVISNSSNANTTGKNVQNIQNITHVSGKTVTNTNDD